MIESRVRSASERAADQIRNVIVRGLLPPGASIPPEAQLMEIFEVSRPTMREALRLLELDNLIDVVRGPRGGAKVRPLTPELTARVVGQTLQASRTTLADVFAARALIEPPAARMAAETNPGAAALALRKQIIAEYEALGAEPLAYEMTAFHIRLVEVSGNQTLALVGRALQQIILTHLHLAGGAPVGLDPEWLNTQRRMLQAHERLADLIAKGDGAGAEAHWTEQMGSWIPDWLHLMSNGQLDILEKSPEFREKSAKLVEASKMPERKRVVD